jgi:hypothetical protein
LKSLYDEALAQEGIIGLSVGTRPDCVTDETIGLLSGYAKDYHVWLEYGLQTIHDRTLKFINRGHDYETFKDAVRRTAGKNINICVHIIVGLPGESKEDMLETARTIAALPIDGIKIHFLLALKGTALGNLYEQGKVGIITKEEYIDTVCDILEILPPRIVIQRLTADGYKDIYLAPEWGRNKIKILNEIDKELKRRNSYQGSKSGV